MDPPEPPGGSEPATDGGRVATYSTGFGSLLLTVAVLAIWYPILRSMAEPLQALSSTAIVVVTVAIWTATWLAFELLWTWYVA
ncbi:MAG: hypothetical protein ACOCSF_00985 [Halanaeroarchaeum sp.]